jgi:phosphatidylserine/phosphatidylglycerophosphate/cardiolipin synthase-like enzyme
MPGRSRKKALSSSRGFFCRREVVLGGLGRRKSQQMHLMAIVHSKCIVIDPFSDDCAVITGSHNFSDAASAKNDENLVIIKGNKQLAQAYALHINGVYDHYSWRAYLGSGGDPDQIYRPLELRF